VGKRMTVTKVYGGAGCGKTHYLTSKISEMVKSGCHARNICMITLTTNARDEFVKRVKDATETPRDDMVWFSTMHSVAGKIIGKSNEWMTTKDDNMFKAGYYAKGTQFDKLNNINQVRRNCMEANTSEGIRNAMYTTGQNMWYPDGTSGGSYVTERDVIRFGNDYMDYMKHIEKIDFARGIEECITHLQSNDDAVMFDYLFVDEFQDFSPLQYSLYVELSKQVEDTWICGDDHQSIYRFSGSSPKFMINTKCDEEVILPKTYRFGEHILQNSMKYVNKMSVKKNRDIKHSDIDDEVVMLHGHEWLRYAKTSIGATVYLTRSKKHAYQIRKMLGDMGIKTAPLGGSGGKTTIVQTIYNTIRAMDSGDEASTEDVILLIKSLPVAVDKIQLLKRGMKTKIEELAIDDYYTAETFASSFLHSEQWDAHTMITYATGVRKFLVDNDALFPDEVDVHINHFVGTIHKFKGNEADNVFLFTQLPYPFSKALYYKDGLDEELRTFYVGATRAKYKLYEVDGYLYSMNGSIAMDIKDFL